MGRPATPVAPDLLVRHDSRWHWWSAVPVGVRTAAVVAAATLVVVGLVFFGPVPGPLGLLLVGLAAAVAAAVLGSPMLAVVVLLVASFTRSAVDVPGLPTEPMILALGGLLVSVLIALNRRKVTWQVGWVELAMAAYVVWNLASAIWPHALPAVKPDTGEAIETVRFVVTGTVMPFVAFLAARALFRSGASVRPVLTAIVVVAGYSALVSVLQFTGPTALVWPRYIIDSPDWKDRAVGIFNQPVVNGLTMVAGFLVAMFLAQEPSVRRFPRFASLLVAVLCVPGIYLTRTRTVWLVFGIGLVLCVLFARGRRTGFALVLTGAVLFIAATWSTFTSSDRSSGGVGSTSEVDDRLNSIATSWWAIQREPIFGWGIGRFTAINTYYHQKWAPQTNFTRGYAISSHENELGIAAELGIIGLALWLVVMAGMIVLLVRALRRLPATGLDARAVALLATIIFGTWVVSGFTADLRFFDFANLLVFVLIGMAVGLTDRHDAGTGPPLPAVPERVPAVIR